MANMPTLTDSGQRLYDSIQTLAQQDAANGYALANLCSALAAMLDPVASIVRDPDAGSNVVPGWAVLFDIPAQSDPKWLQWVAQFVGSDLTGVTDVPTMRSLIQNPTGYNRGTVAALRTRAAVTLTGSQTVLVTERVGGNPWKITVTTYTSETPNPTATLQSLLSVKRAGLILTYNVVAGGTYAVVAGAHSSYSALAAAHSTYSDIPVHPTA